MGGKFFLSEEQLVQAHSELLPPVRPPQGRKTLNLKFYNRDFSLWLGDQLLKKIKSFPQWEKAGPILLGSWARQQLCPKSDIDLLFCGDEKAVAEIVDLLNHQGLKIRYRVPLDPQDWTQGAEAFDILALLEGQALTPHSQILLEEQKQRIWANQKMDCRLILKTIKKERLVRAIRHDSITNFLEPNIKYGAGGLRDLQQGLSVYQFFPERFEDLGRARQVFQFYQNFFLTIRQKLHLLGGQDILLAPYQEEISHWFGYKNKTEFMSEVELGLSRVGFYSDWILAVASSSVKKINERKRLPIHTPELALKALKKFPDVLMQFEVRQKLEFLSNHSVKLRRHLKIEQGEKFFVALFGSRIIDHLIPHFRAIVGLVQHDQYHRYSVDAHILQCLKVLCRLRKNKNFLLGAQKIFSQLNPEDFEILLWASLYHDIGKGSGQPHEIYGAQRVRQDAKKLNLGKVFCEEVAWIVENHLVLSRFAFRQNLRSPQTWKALSEKGIVGQRLWRLAAFTAVDIYATNPEAWNSWKAQLINDVVDVMSGNTAQSFIKFVKLIERRKLNSKSDFVNRLDPMIVDALPAKVLVEDYSRIQQSQGDVEPFVVKTKLIWIRFHQQKDRPGIFFELVQRLYSCGFNIQNAFAQTFSDVGVYDWFEIKTNHEAHKIKRILEGPIILKPLPEVAFSGIEIVSSDEKETVISFRGLDQPGVLAKASWALTRLGLTIHWARVLTWGRQFDDVFGVNDPQKRDWNDLLTKIKNFLIIENKKKSQVI